MSKITSLFIGAFLYSNILLAQVEGDVVDPNDIGIGKAILTATDSTGKLIDTATTDKRGFYFFKSLKPGRYNIEAKADGYTAYIFENIVVKKEYNRANEWDDTYYAIRLDFILKPKNPRK